MSDPADNAVDNAEIEEGRKRREREKFILCAGINKENEIIYEFIPANNIEEAAEIFKAKFKIPPTVTDASEKGNGWHKIMGGISAVERISVTVSVKQLARRTTQAISAEFKGWEVYGSGLKACTVEVPNKGMVKFKDNELISIDFGKYLGEKPEDGKKPQKPKLKKKEVIPKSALKNVQLL